MVERDHPQINVNQYIGLDQFGRIDSDNWYNTSTAISTDDFAYGYDQDSNVLYKQNLVNTAMSELYQYNNLDELINFARGTLNSTDNGIMGTPSASQSWAPDALGNFTSVTTNGSTQASTFNQQNEITSISGQGTVSYDADGNLTADGSGNTYVYNAWDQLVTVKNSSGTTIAAYGYDGLGRRITVTENTTTTDLYYSSADQVVEEDVGGVAQSRNVWSPVYVNALVLVDQSSQHNGVLDQRLYVQQDANWNVTALVDASGNVVERYDYLPYGSITVLNPSWTPITESAYNVPLGYQGMGYDWTVGLNYSRTREYDPVLMRWLETDPIGLNAGTDDYEFVGNRPTNGVDPSGLQRRDFESPSETMKRYEAIKEEYKQNHIKNLEARFMDWYSKEKKERDQWLKTIPIPPPQLPRTKIKIHGYRRDWGPVEVEVMACPEGWIWDEPFVMGWPLYYHPNASYGIRSIPKNGVQSGAQAMYDAKGKLITDGLSAGTADRISPTNDRPGHIAVDVKPFDWSYELDKYYGGDKFRKMYREVRPPNTGNATRNIVD